MRSPNLFETDLAMTIVEPADVSLGAKQITFFSLKEL